MLRADAPHLAQGDVAQPGAATLLRDEDLQGAEDGRRGVVVDCRAQRLAPPVGRELIGIERDGHAVDLDQKLVRRLVEPPELERAESLVQLAPAAVQPCRREA